jgi:hypothetical protein
LPRKEIVIILQNGGYDNTKIRYNRSYIINNVKRLLTTPSEDCLLWGSSKDVDGYAQTSDGTRVHCLALEIKLGRKIAKGYQTAHSCRNRHCYSPWHLSEKTSKQNTHDQYRDKTSPRHHGLLSTNTSGYKGVSPNKSKTRWIAFIHYGKHRYLGTFDLAEDAARVYDKAAKAAWGTDCFLNFPDE